MPIYLISKYVHAVQIQRTTSWNPAEPLKKEDTGSDANIDIDIDTNSRDHRFADPVFAFTIGTSAALIRIRREEREKHPERAGEIGFEAIAKTGADRVRRWWAGDFEGL
ncbi:hypothetical protein IFM58399_06997 [Aspergillus lentulus]|uniref:Uncharacterized protein n=1 Tax=Aspergillus lentulus TaxID=293939 RepID=A0ABQ1APP6_ASPLE|nr:uncharacterized protein IFM58399_06997 [Aspergillus lentulus]KAF4155405.1 hypothetical protein CNMCM6069_008029 [Aspergillus lentulus]KAF4174941.1 hypothetical protein CNMCM8060_007952 [Aspergillus lentulus]KAF4184085.1 hypothetical protein CNMCM7927_008378 [Aspergillus lentulus]KAF4194149.1 hypothetical protein CNMCM8694_007924 [Aspergillus lentulus]GFF43587.1 hypothetical protein IFM58399_06997 [Aspergillus lentulus]